jgi:hypothetical protein
MDFFQFYSLAINICLCIEISLTMTDPFYPAERRMKFYIIGSTAAALILPFITLTNSFVGLIPM